MNYLLKLKMKIQKNHWYKFLDYIFFSIVDEEENIRYIYTSFTEIEPKVDYLPLENYYPDIIELNLTNTSGTDIYLKECIQHSIYFHKYLADKRIKNE